MLEMAAEEPAMDKLSRIAALATLVGMSASALAAEGGDKAKEGQLAFNNHCRTCHSVKEGDNRLGPTMHGVVGRKAGTVAGYAAYSGAMKGAGITWDVSSLDKFIADPEAVVRNNNMKPYKGIPDAGLRKQIVAYLESIG
jgi:cytochrome c